MSSNLLSESQIQAIWQYRIKIEYRREFVAAYSAAGSWAQLFHRCPGYLRTELLRDPTDERTFLTVDYWQSREMYEEMHQRIADEYDRLDHACAEFTVSEVFVGIFSTLQS